MMNLAKYIDHTLLKPESTRSDIIRVCEEAKHYNTASVCVNPCWAKLVSEQLKGTDIKTCCVIGFPLGATLPEVKAYETAAAIRDGAQEVDMVINVGALRSAQFETVYEDIKAVVNAAAGKALVKVIIETCLLTDDQKVIACKLAKQAGADYVKTSTGFSTGGAKVEDIRLMRETVGPEMGVKASGGVRTKEDAEAMIAAGATRIGASSSKKIIEG